MAAAIRTGQICLPTFDTAGIERVRDAAPGALLAVVSSLATDEALRSVQSVEGISLILSKRDPPDRLVAALRERFPAVG